jgi:hypothetical protein
MLLMSEISPLSILLLEVHILIQLEDIRCMLL